MTGNNHDQIKIYRYKSYILNWIFKQRTRIMTPEKGGDKLLEPISWKTFAKRNLVGSPNCEDTNKLMTAENKNNIMAYDKASLNWSRKDIINELTKEDLLNVIGDALITKLSNTPNKITSTPEELIKQDVVDGSETTSSERNDGKTGEQLNRTKSPEFSDNSTNSILNILENQTISNNFKIPVNTIVQKINEIQNLSRILGNKEKKLENWYFSLISILNNFIEDLNNDKIVLSNEFVKSLQTITKIFSITSKFSPIEAINESVLTPSIRGLIMDFKANSFSSLENYCSETLSMSTLTKDVEENLIRLMPILSQQLQNFNKQLKIFYSLYSLVDDYGFTNSAFLEQLPTKSDIKLFNEINEATDIKLILQTNFSEINPTLITQLDDEIKRLSTFIKDKIEELRTIISTVVKINNDLYSRDEKEFLELPSFLNDDDLLLSKKGIKSSTFVEYQARLNELNELRLDREKILNSHLARVEHLWSILRPNSDEIQHFLKQNKHLHSSAIKNFEMLLNELEAEKLANIKKFIQMSRQKICGFWDVLMYDNDSRAKFQEYYIDDETQFDENLLNIHSNELEKLRNESESLKPLLNLISKLNGLIEEKKVLDEASKDPSRLLKRNSFKILKQEEKTRDRLTKLFPMVIDEIKDKITEFESNNGRLFKLNGESYKNRLEEIENFCTHSKRPTRSSFNSPKTLISNSRNLSANKNPTSATRNSSIQITSKSTRSKMIATPSHSIIRKRNLSDMSNPFLSREATPSRHKRPTYETPSTSSTKRKLSSINNSSSSLANKPIILRGGSPVKSLNFKASTKITMNKSSIPTISDIHASNNTKISNQLSNRSPMGLLDISNNRTNIPNFKIYQQNREESIPVEELSDSILDYSDNESTNKENNKVFLKTNVLLNNKISPKKDDPSTKKFNLSLDSETF